MTTVLHERKPGSGANFENRQKQTQAAIIILLKSIDLASWTQPHGSRPIFLICLKAATEVTIYTKFSLWESHFASEFRKNY